MEFRLIVNIEHNFLVDIIELNYRNFWETSRFWVSDQMNGISSRLLRSEKEGWRWQGTPFIHNLEPETNSIPIDEGTAMIR